jgi:hypothetical protein
MFKKIFAMLARFGGGEAPATQEGSVKSVEEALNALSPEEQKNIADKYAREAEMPEEEQTIDTSSLEESPKVKEEAEELDIAA